MNQNLFERAFVHSRLKIDRANRHINEIEQWFRMYVESDFYQLLDDLDPETGDQIIRLKANPIPADLALAIGDAFHCLNAALDYVMSGLMLAKTGNSTRIYFPSHDERDSLRKSFMPPRAGKADPPNRRVMKAFPLIAFELLSVIKPYKGGDFSIWEVRKADNIDKHNLIVPSITVARVEGIEMRDNVRQNTYAGMTLSVGAGGVMKALHYGGKSKLEITNKGHASASISFPDGLEVFQGRPVLPTLLECSQLVAEVVGRVEVTARRYL